MKRCPACLHKYHSRRLKCPYCHCVMPDKAEIAAACEAIQVTWTKTEERKRRQVRNPLAEVPVVHEVTDHMVRRDASSEARK